MEVLWVLFYSVVWWLERTRCLQTYRTMLYDWTRPSKHCSDHADEIEAHGPDERPYKQRHVLPYCSTCANAELVNPAQLAWFPQSRAMDRQPNLHDMFTGRCRLHGTYCMWWPLFKALRTRSSRRVCQDTSVSTCTRSLFCLPHSFPGFPDLSLDIAKAPSCIDSIRDRALGAVATGLIGLI